MIDLPPLDRIWAVRIARDGGLAWTPGLSRPRSVRLGDCDAVARQRIGQALRDAASYGSEGGAGVQGGDRRCYRVEVVLDDGDGCPRPTISFEVPEEQAPESLVWMWSEAG